MTILRHIMQGIIIYALLVSLYSLWLAVLDFIEYTRRGDGKQNGN